MSSVMPKKAPPLFGESQMMEIIDMALACSDADQTKVVISRQNSELTRFAKSRIHQNVAELNASIEIKAVIGKKIGYASTNSLESDAIKDTVLKAVLFARNQQENPDFVSLPTSEKSGPHPQTYYQQTVDLGPEGRADAVSEMISVCDKYYAEASGALSNGFLEFAVGNSLGIRQYNKWSSIDVRITANVDTGYGYADLQGKDVSMFNFKAVAEEAAERASRSQNPQPIDPGEYDVVILPFAAEEFLSTLAYLGLGALAVQENRSFMCGKFGEKICGENITIWDDGYDPRTQLFPFDPEGVNKQKVVFIENGVAKEVCWDSYTAHREGRKSTGHSSGGTGTWGPYPMNMLLAPGDSTIEEMINNTERGLLVTRFWYTNVLHPIMTTFTGMTRDGLFLIENGKITKPVTNLRFTDNVLDALSNVEMIGKELKLQGIAAVPAMKIKKFRFTGRTEF